MIPDNGYIDNALARASYRILEDGSLFGEIPGLTGVWSNEADPERCRRVLRRVLEEWLYIKRRYHEEIPYLEVNPQP